MLRGDGYGYPAPGIEPARHNRSARLDRPDQIFENAVNDFLMERAVVSERKEIELQGFAFQAQAVRDITDRNVCEVRLACDRAEACELRAVKLDPVVPLAVLVGKCLKPGLVGRIRKPC